MLSLLSKNKNFFNNLLIALAAVLVYANSFQVPFIFDDKTHILANPRIQDFWPPWEVLRRTNRPLVDLSLALNYLLGKTNPFGYHIFNLLVHLSAALTLYALLHRTFRMHRTPQPIKDQAQNLAFAATLLWTVHPLLTQSVTYTIQRAESMMGLFYLLTVYSVARADQEKQGYRWQTLAVIFCAAGTGCKEVMVTAPLVSFIYDRIFLAASFREILEKRLRMYFNFLFCWALLLFLATAERQNPIAAGLTIEGLTPFNYGLTQFGVIAHYIRLIFWPQPLCFDYFSWPLASGIADVFPQFVFIAVLLSLTVWSLRAQAFWGFWGIWFFFILAVTSSVFPIGDLAFEHRMYLPSIAWIVLTVCGGYVILHRVVKKERTRLLWGGFVVMLLALTLGWMTIQRNRVYQDEFTLWQDVLDQWPENDRAQTSLGNLFSSRGELERAQSFYEDAVKSSPANDKPYYALATVYLRMNDFAAARENLRKALTLNPDFTEASFLMGMSYLQENNLEDARKFFRQSPDSAAAHYQLALLDFADGKFTDAIAHFQTVLRQDPDNVAAHYNLATALANLGHLQEAFVHFNEAFKLDPEFLDVKERIKTLREILGEN